jgi:glutamate dehydrogenase (NAD(P)+)
VYAPEGLDVEKLKRYHLKHKSIRNFPGAKTLPAGKDALEVSCDVLIPAALENQLTLENAARVKARIVAEAANGPTTPGAERELIKRGILVIPDIYLNAGGVVVSYFEWGKNISHMRYGRLEKRLEEYENEAWIRATEGLVGKRFTGAVRRGLSRGASEEDLVNSGLEETMCSAYDEIREIRNKHRSVQSLRTAAYMSAIQKIATSYLELGIFP